MITGIFNGNDTTAFTPGNDGNRFDGITSKGKEESIQFLVAGENVTDNVFSSFCGV